MEFVNKITGYVLALVLGAILVGGLLIPTVEGIQTTIGEEITLNNTLYDTENYDYTLWGGEDIVLSYTPSPDISTAGIYYVNGVEVPLQGIAQRIIIASNDFASRSGGTAISVLNSQFVESNAQLGNVAFTYTIENKEYTLELGNNTYTGNVDWLVYADNDGTMNLGQIKNPDSNPFYTSISDNVIVLGNIYTTGDNDTFYSYYDGQLTVNSSYQDESSITINKTLAQGYTDIYSTSITIDVDEESFSPWFVLAPKTVNGHVAGGTYYIMFGVISLLAIVILVVIAANAIRAKY